MDLLNIEDYIEKYMSFKHTSQINDAFGFYGIGDRNFLHNSGSYFAI